MCSHCLPYGIFRIESKCVIVGDAAYAEAYKDSLYSLTQGDPRIVFTGYVFGKGYHELGTNAAIFVETSGVGGTHPALIEAMAHGNCVIAHDTPENIETLGDVGLYYQGKRGSEDLRVVLAALLNSPEKVKNYAERARIRANTVYTWEAVTDAYERLFYLGLGRSIPARLVDI